MESSNVITLYHGTIHDVTKIDVACGKPYKDFGQGFYLTETYEHALNIARRNRGIERDRRRVVGDETEAHLYVFVYDFAPREAAQLNVKRFETADREWLRTERLDCLSPKGSMS